MRATRLAASLLSSLLQNLTRFLFRRLAKEVVNRIAAGEVIHKVQMIALVALAMRWLNALRAMRFAFASCCSRRRRSRS